MQHSSPQKKYNTHRGQAKRFDTTKRMTRIIEGATFVLTPQQIGERLRNAGFKQVTRTNLYYWLKLIKKHNPKFRFPTQRQLVDARIIMKFRENPLISNQDIAQAIKTESGGLTVSNLTINRVARTLREKGMKIPQVRYPPKTPKKYPPLSKEKEAFFVNNLNKIRSILTSVARRAPSKAPIDPHDFKSFVIANRAQFLAPMRTPNTNFIATRAKFWLRLYRVHKLQEEYKITHPQAKLLLTLLANMQNNSENEVARVARAAKQSPDTALAVWRYFKSVQLEEYHETPQDRYAENK